MKLFSKKRNATSYDVAGNVTKHELEQVIAVAHELRQNGDGMAGEESSGADLSWQPLRRKSQLRDC